MKKKVTKPTGPVEDTVYYEIGYEIGVGVRIRPGNNAAFPFQTIIRPIASVSSQDLTKLRQYDTPTEISVGDRSVRACSAAYVYAWVEMQKNLTKYRLEQKGKKKA